MTDVRQLEHRCVGDFSFLPVFLDCSFRGVAGLTNEALSVIWVAYNATLLSTNRQTVNEAAMHCCSKFLRDHRCVKERIRSRGSHITIQSDRTSLVQRFILIFFWTLLMWWKNLPDTILDVILYPRKAHDELH